MESTLQDILISHSITYPEMEVSDYIKLIYQNVFGSGHMISNMSDSESYLKTEYQTVLAEANEHKSSLFIDAIGNGLCRIYLNPDKIAPDFLPLLNRFFAATANTHKGSISEFREKTSVLYELATQNRLPLIAESVKSYLQEYFLEGCPPVHHSKTFQKKYHPHYRVIRTDYTYYFPAFQSIQRQCESGRPIIIAVDGRCASGKSMFAKLLSEVFTCNVFHMDDFFLPFPLRTPERLSKAGGNIDYERFLKEVLKPLTKGRDICFQPFDCSTRILKPPVFMPASSLSIVEGSYSLHPFLIKFYDFRIFLTCTPDMHKQRLLNREGKEMLQQFVERWIPLEEHYFNSCEVADHCDMELDTSDFFEINEK